MASAPEYLVEIDAYVGAAVETLRFSSGGYATSPSDSPPNTPYDRAVIDPGSISRSLFDDGRTFGQARSGYGEIVLSNVAGRLDFLISAGVDGRAVRVKRLTDRRSPLSSAELVLRGTIERIDTSRALNEVRFKLYDRRLELEQPLQLNKYTGATISGGLSGNLTNGTADMAGKPKPLVFGRVTNIAPAPVNPFDLIYQVSDGAVASIAVFDGCIALLNAGDFTTAATLRAAAIPAGKFGTCLALGLFRIGVDAAFTLTADVVEGSTLALRSAGAVSSRMLTKMAISGAANVNTASFTALNSAAPQEVGIFIDSEMTGLSAITRVLESVGGYIIPNAIGAFEVGRLLNPTTATPTWSLVEQQIVGDDMSIVSNPDTDHGIPAWAISLNYAPVYVVQQGEMICEGASTARRGLVGKQYRTTRVEGAAVQTKYQLSPEMTISTLMASASNAAAEAARRHALYSVRRDVLVLHVLSDDATDKPLGSVGTLTLDRYGYDAGRRMAVIGREQDLPTEQVILTLWG